MLPECALYCKDTYATNFRINLQIINDDFDIPHFQVHNARLIHILP